MGRGRERLDLRGKDVVTVPEEAAGMILGTGWRMTQGWSLETIFGYRAWKTGPGGMLPTAKFRTTGWGPGGLDAVIARPRNQGCHSPGKNHQTET